MCLIDVRMCMQGFYAEWQSVATWEILGVVWHTANIQFFMSHFTNNCDIVIVSHNVVCRYMYMYVSVCTPRWAWLCRSSNHIADAARAERCRGSDGVDRPRATGHVCLLHVCTQVLSIHSHTQQYEIICCMLSVHTLFILYMIVGHLMLL